MGGMLRNIREQQRKNKTAADRDKHFIKTERAHLSRAVQRGAWQSQLRLMAFA